jgi:predicted acetyltransferase
VTPEVRRVRDEELVDFVRALTTAFLEPRPVEPIADELRPLWDLDRVWAAFDGDRICGTFRSWATELTVPGGATIPGAAVAAVTVLPTHRRRGILRSMVAAEHAAIRERGEVVGLLYASEYPIYRRFGYGVGCRDAAWTLDARGTGFGPASSGRVDVVEVSATSRDQIKGVFETWRRRQVGEIRRRDFSWDYDLGLRPTAWGEDWKGFLAIHRAPDGPVDGYARYRAEDHWERRQPHSTINVDELHALSDEAYVSLWRFLAETDWVATVKALRRSPDERLPWLLTNARAASASDVADGLWVRLMDVPRALAARTYAREGDLVLEVHDDEAPDGALRIALAAGPDGATCTATDRLPDLTIDVAALGSAYLGGVRLRDAVALHGADEHTAGALLAAERLFHMPDEPWCSTFF